ncbi:hypothetical protein [Rhodococcus sp. BP-316]|uniref:hypothetical protein n=1 Tax=Rhodococcus sp. BP-316 TaxID=2739445 RepID=UPI0021BE3036|nr:hypothetical protein [Rhodococcus sp. BP-316]
MHDTTTVLEEGNTVSTVLITTDYLHPGDDVDTLLRAHGHETVHSPRRRASPRR